MALPRSFYDELGDEEYDEDILDSPIDHSHGVLGGGAGVFAADCTRKRRVGPSLSTCPSGVAAFVCGNGRIGNRDMACGVNSGGKVAYMWEKRFDGGGGGVQFGCDLRDA